MLVDVAAAAPQLLAQSLAEVEELFSADDPLLSECAAQLLARAGSYMAAHVTRQSLELPPSLADELKRMAGEASPAGAKAAVKALWLLLGRERAATQLGSLCDSLLDLLKRPSTLASHRKLLAAGKALSTVGRCLPGLFAGHVEEFADFVLNQLLAEDLSRWDPGLTCWVVEWCVGAQFCWCGVGFRQRPFSHGLVSLLLPWRLFGCSLLTPPSLTLWPPLQGQAPAPAQRPGDWAQL